MEKKCGACGQSYEAKTVRSRFCVRPDCRRKRARAWKHKERTGAVVELRPPAELDAGLSVEAAARAELEGAGRLNTTIGRAVLVLARQLDQGDGDTGSSKASVAGKLRELMAEALKDVKRAADPIDEIAERRRKRQARAR